MQDLHIGTWPVDKNEDIPILDVSPHLVGHYSTKGVKATAHIRWIRIQIVSHRRCKAKHITGAIKPTTNATSLDPEDHSL